MRRLVCIEQHPSPHGTPARLPKKLKVETVRSTGSYLIVGATGLIGSALNSALSRTATVWVAGRRPPMGLNSHVVPLDLSASIDVSFPVVDTAFLCAATSNFLACEADPVATRKVNALAISRVARCLLEQGTFTVFLSSSAVFDGNSVLPDEAKPYSSTTEYGKQKAEAERQLLQLDAGRGNVAIVRLTKVFSSRTPVVRGFMQHLEKGERFDAFADLYLCPVSLRYVVQSLLEIERRRSGGIFHLSGSVELSYADFARRLAGKMGVSPDLVGESTVEASPTPVLYRPRHPALGMTLTSRSIGLHAEPLDTMLANLLARATAEP